jgi:hypothetical protein
VGGKFQPRPRKEVLWMFSFILSANHYCKTA